MSSLNSCCNVWIFSWQHQVRHRWQWGVSVGLLQESGQQGSPGSPHATGKIEVSKKKKIVFKDIINKLQRSILQMSVVDVNVTNRLEFAILSQKLLSCCQYSCWPNGGIVPLWVLLVFTLLYLIAQVWFLALVCHVMMNTENIRGEGAFIRSSTIGGSRGFKDFLRHSLTYPSDSQWQ